MTLKERHEQILSILNQSGAVSVCSLSERLDVSSVTIRKDLSILENKKLLYRSHGSAILINPYINDRPINEKEKLSVKEKKAIGMEAAKIINPKDSIIIASGTTMYFLAKEVNRSNNLTVITSSTNISSILSSSSTIKVIQLGGYVRSTSASTVGEFAEKMLDNFSCNKLFMGVDGIDLDYGITTTNSMEASLNRKMIEVSQKTIILCDSSKFGKRGFGKICGLESIHQIITDNNVSPRIVESLTEMGIEVIVVPVI